MEHVNVLIVGAGLSGIGAAAHLRRKCPGHRFTILEGRERLGGTWDLFRYPGIRSDSDMYTFGYAFKPWVEDQDIATGEAILRYLRETVEEHRLEDDIRFGHRVERVSWSSADRRWVADVHRVEDDARFQISADFLLTCTGYYNYDQGHLPKFVGWDDYQGVVAHPQHWPEDLDYRGKRVLVIGSGATAVTIVPSMAKGGAAHVTMLQRSPTYIFSRPAEDAVARGLRRVLPDRVAHSLTRVKNVAMSTFMYKLARRAPDRVRGHLRTMAKEALGPEVDVDVHFNPSYDPWDQRLCLIPDGDLYASLRDGSASVVTDTIDHFTETGVVLTSGEAIEADIVVPATGLELQFLGGMEMEVDGRVVAPNELVSYRGMMFGGVPNWVAVIGYTNASWTLKADLTSDFVCRLLTRMDERGYDTVVPRMREPMETRPILATLSSGYVQRAADRMPRQGVEAPWQNQDSYPKDFLSLKLADVEDGVLEFGGGRPPRPRGRFSLRGKTALVTGAAGGIGEALALELAGRGAQRLLLVDVDEARLASVADRVEARGAEVRSFVVDMGDAEAVEGFAVEIAKRYPDLDLLINNAGVALGGDVEEVPREDLEWLMGINFFGVANLTRALLPTLLARPDAHVANVSSVFGLIAPAGQAAYCASKFAVRGWTEALRRELSDTSVGVSVIHPGGVKTGIARNARVPDTRPLQPGEREAAVAQAEAAFITTPADAATQILDGVERRRPRILVGPDARVIEWLERLLPVRNMEVLGRLLGWGHRARRRGSRAQPSDARAQPPAGAHSPTISA